MLHSLQLAAIVKQRAQRSLLGIPLHQGLQRLIAQDWESQLTRFVDEVEFIVFEPGYKTERHQCFEVSPFPLPEWLNAGDTVGFENLDVLDTSNRLARSISAIVARARTDDDEEILLFQNFTQSRVIRPVRFLSFDWHAWLMDQHTNVNVERPGLILDNKLSAIYQITGESLRFRNYRTVNTFLPLSDFYREASEQDIMDVLSHPLFAPENVEIYVSESNEWFKKRFAMLRDSDILDEFSAKEIKARSEGYEVSVTLVNDRIVFPSEKQDAMQLLKFLNEELYKGPITERLYEANSRRPIDRN